VKSVVCQASGSSYRELGKASSQGRSKASACQIVDLHIDHTVEVTTSRRCGLDAWKVALGVAIKINMPEEIRRLGLNAILMATQVCQERSRGRR
jgi:hypothetical protein